MDKLIAVIGYKADWDNWLREGRRRLFRPGMTRDYDGTRWVLVQRREQAMGVDWTDHIVISGRMDGVSEIVTEIRHRMRATSLKQA